MRPSSFLLVVGTAVPDSFSWSAPWSVEPVAFFGGSSPPQVAVDSAGAPQVLYCPVGEAWWSARTDSGWAREFVTATPGGGGCGGLALGPDDDPHVYMYSKLAGGLAAAKLWTRASPTWTSVAGTVPSGSIAVDLAGRVHMVAETAVAKGGSFEHYLQYSVYDGVAWQVTLVDFMGTTGFAFIGAHWEQVVVDAASNPHLLYYDPIRGDVRYASRDAAGWHVEVVEHIGFIGFIGRHGSVASGSDGTVHAAYLADVTPVALNRASLRHAVRTAAGWTIETVDGPPGMKGFSPTMLLSPAGRPRIGFQNWGPSGSDLDLQYASLDGATWAFETVYDAPILGVQFPSFAIDRCGNPHAAFFSNDDRGVMYATKGDCPDTAATASLRIEPRTLNLRSKGKWITATLTLEGATTQDVDLSSLAVNGIAPDRVQVLNNTVLQLKVSREEFIDTLPDPPRFGTAVTVTLTGQWRGGGSFTAADTIRITRPGR